MGVGVEGKDSKDSLSSEGSRNSRNLGTVDIQEGSPAASSACCSSTSDLRQDVVGSSNNGDIPDSADLRIYTPAGAGFLTCDSPENMKNEAHNDESSATRETPDKKLNERLAPDEPRIEPPQIHGYPEPPDEPQHEFESSTSPDTSTQNSVPDNECAQTEQPTPSMTVAPTSPILFHYDSWYGTYHISPGSDIEYTAYHRFVTLDNSANLRLNSAFGHDDLLAIYDHINSGYHVMRLTDFNRPAINDDSSHHIDFIHINELIIQENYLDLEFINIFQY